MKPRALAVLLLMGAVPSLAWIIPDDENIQSVFGQPRDQFQELFKTTQEKLESKLDTFVEDLQKSVHAHQEYVQAEIDAAFDEYFEPEGPQVNENLEFFDTEAWVEHAQFEMSDLDEEPEIEYSFSVTRHKHKGHKDHKHHKGKHHYKEHDHEGHDDDDPADGTDPGEGPPYYREPDEPPHHTPNPHHGHKNHRPKMPPSDHTGPHMSSTLWDLISSSKHTKRFHDLLKEDEEIVKMLQDENTNITVFAPANHAFGLLDNYRKHHDLPKDLIHKVLLYHIAPGFHKSQDLRYHNTLITKLPDGDLGEGMHQRLRIGLGHKEPSINFYSQFTMFDVYGQNGVVHGIYALLLPPPDILDLVQVLPTEFSTTEAALHRTGLLQELPKLRGKGLTVFTPSNRDWQKLGFKINAFLFSECGNKYLRALMKYHVVPDHTLYSDAVVCPGKKKEDIGAQNELDDPSGLNHGYSHVDLPTLLTDRHISVDITRLERFLSFRINGLNSIIISDGIAKSGSIQVPDHVLIPPHSLREHYDPPGVLEEEDEEDLDGGIYSLEQFKQIFAPFVEQEQRELEVLEAQEMLRESSEL